MFYTIGLVIWVIILWAYTLYFYKVCWFYKGLLIFKLCVCVLMCMCSGVQLPVDGYLEVSGLLELKWWVVTNYPTWVLRTKVGSSEGAVCALNHCPTSLVPPSHMLDGVQLSLEAHTDVLNLPPWCWLCHENCPECWLSATLLKYFAVFWSYYLINIAVDSNKKRLILTITSPTQFSISTHRNH